MYMNGIKYNLQVQQNDQCDLLKVKFIDIGSLASYVFIVQQLLMSIL